MNMALDEIFFSISLEKNMGFFRFYEWKHPCISLGYFQKPTQNQLQTYPCVRRLTGGGIVFHDQDLTFSFCAPLKEPFENAFAIYQFFSSLFMKSFSGLTDNDDLEILTKSASKSRFYNCFDLPVSADILHRGKKIYGGAIRKKKKGFLFQGTLQGEMILRNKKIITQKTVSLLKDIFPDMEESDIPKDIMEKAEKLAREKYYCKIPTEDTETTEFLT